MNLKEAEIQDAILKTYHEKGHYPITLNFMGSGLGECDVISISKSDFIYEFEIKISRSDFKADLKNKEAKHEGMKNNPGVHSYDACRMRNGKSYKIPNAYTKFDAPNYFFYVCPDGLIRPSEVPEYAGLIYVGINDGLINGDLVTMKPAPLLHKHKADLELVKMIGRNLTNKLLYSCGYSEYKFTNKWLEKMNEAVKEVEA